MEVRGEKRPHTESADCWCEPFMYHRSESTGREVWVHRACKTIRSEGFHLRLMDNPSPEVLSKAVELAEDPEADEHSDWKP